MLRPTRWLVWIAGSGAVILTGVAMVRVWYPGQSFAQILPIALLFAFSVAAFVHFLWFYYLELGGGALRQVKYFGLYERTVLVSDLTLVGPETEINVFGARIPSVELMYLGGKIILSTARYPVADLTELVSRLGALGAPLNPGLLPALLDLTQARRARTRKSR